VRINRDFCAEVAPFLDQLIEMVIRTQEATDRTAGFFLFQSYAKKGASMLADVISGQMSASIGTILTNHTENQNEAVAILDIASYCMIANREVLPSFFGTGSSFLDQAVAVVAQIADNPILPLTASLQFISATIWRSRVAAERFISSVVSFQKEGQQSAIVSLVTLCLRETKEPLRSVACLSVLESLLWKTSAPAFSQLISIVRSHVGITELMAVVESYSKSLADEQSLWSGFVQDVFREIQGNSDALLSTNAEVHGELMQIAALQARLSEGTAKNEELTRENAEMKSGLLEYQRQVSGLETQVAELQNALDAEDVALQSSREELEAAHLTHEAEMARLRQEIETLRLEKAELTPLHSKSTPSLQLEYTRCIGFEQAPSGILLPNEKEKLERGFEEERRMLENEIGDLKYQLEAARAQKGPDGATNESSLLEAQDEVARLTAALESQAAELNDAQNAVESLRKSVAALKAENESLWKRLNRVPPSESSNKLQSRVAALLTQNAQLRRKNEQENAMRLESEEELKAFRLDNEELKQRLRGLEEECATLQSNSRETTAEVDIAGLEAANKELESQCAALREQVNANLRESNEIDTLEARLAQLAAANKELESQCAALGRSAEEERAKLQSSNEGLRLECAALRSQLSSNSDRVTPPSSPKREEGTFDSATLALNCGRLRAQLTAKTAECDRLQRELDTLRDRFSQIDLDLDLAEQSAIRAELVELKGARKRDARAFKRESLALTSQIRRLEAEKSAWQERAAASEAEKLTAEDEMASLRGLVQTQLTELHEMKRQMQAERTHTESLRGQHRQLATRAEEAEAQLLELQTQNDSLRAHLKDAREMTAVHKQLQQRALEMERTEANARSVQKQNEDLRRRLAVARATAAARKAELAKLREGVPLLAGKVRELQAQLREMRGEVEAVWDPTPWLRAREELGRWQARESERVRAIERASRVVARRAENAQRKLAEEREENAALAAKVEALTGIETKHKKALRLLGEYHCRIQTLTGSGSPRINRINPK
jgi:chromosome segregation ATPase